MTTHKATAKTSFLIYKDFDAQLQSLTNEQAGIYLKALYAFQHDRPHEITDPIVRFALKLAFSRFEADNEKYSVICGKRSDAGKRSAEQKLTNANKRKHKSTSATEENRLEEKRVDIEEIKKKDISSLPAEAVRIVDLLINHVRTVNSNPRNLSEPKFERTRLAWATDIEKANRLDSRTWEQLEHVLNFAINDDFWSKNILSGRKLRDQFDKLESNSRNVKKSLIDFNQA